MQGFLAGITAIIAPLIALLIYIDRRHQTRRRISGVLLEEIKNNREAAQGQIPHFDQCGITGDSFDSNPLNYSAGDIPPSARLSSKVYESCASEITRFDPELANTLVTYYHHLNYVKTLNDIVHEGKELPPAAYNILRTYWELYLIDIDDSERELKIEMKLFPRVYRTVVAVQDWRKN